MDRHHCPLDEELPDELAGLWLAYLMGEPESVLGVGATPDAALRNAYSFCAREEYEINLNFLTTRFHIEPVPTVDRYLRKLRARNYQRW